MKENHQGFPSHSITRRSDALQRNAAQAKEYLNGAELGEKLPESNVPVLLDKLEFVSITTA